MVGVHFSWMLGFRLHKLQSVEPELDTCGMDPVTAVQCSGVAKKNNSQRQQSVKLTTNIFLLYLFCDISLTLIVENQLKSYTFLSSEIKAHLLQTWRHISHIGEAPFCFCLNWNLWKNWAEQTGPGQGTGHTEEREMWCLRLGSREAPRLLSITTNYTITLNITLNNITLNLSYKTLWLTMLLK